MRLIIPAALAAILASTAAQAQETFCMDPDLAAMEAQARQSPGAGANIGASVGEAWRNATAKCKNGELLIIHFRWFSSLTRPIAIARHCDFTKQVVVLPDAAICYVIQPPRQ
jgi:hypothetical protein